MFSRTKAGLKPSQAIRESGLDTRYSLNKAIGLYACGHKSACPLGALWYGAGYGASDTVGLREVLVIAPELAEYRMNPLINTLDGKPFVPHEQRVYEIITMLNQRRWPNYRVANWLETVGL